ncbi:family 16 glycosylhydrolase [Pseudonocardia endophytica]|uniref:Beta-glucanase (GH16 family) n=1 Tax=Pseudonocardia endophytica TaxID=401976 RepID=A0A4R1HVW3_PSEEN|nr:family 16 glycosylhydrolase [Pseudonocardia endophytica]TCK26448.1 beta-glucanase (GH16 family) [Pseudonocardia endophytica]
MRDDSTVRLNAAAAPHDGASPVAGTVALPSTTVSVEVERTRAIAADGPAERADRVDGTTRVVRSGAQAQVSTTEATSWVPAAAVEATSRVPAAAVEAVTQVSARAAEEGHVPGPGLVIPAAARAPREPRPMPEGRPVMPGGPPPSPPGTGEPGGDRQEWSDRATGGASAPVPPIMDSAAAPAPEQAPSGKAPSGEAPSDLAQPAPSIQATRTMDPPRPAAPRPATPRPAAAPSARPAAPPRPAGPRPTGPGRTAAAVSPSPAVGRAPAGRPPARAVPPADPMAKRGKASRARRAGGVMGGIALGLVAIIAASWTILVPPVGSDDRADERPAAVPARPAAPPVDWVRTNGDEFDGPSLDRSRWNVYNSVGGFGNGLRRPSAVEQGDGLLTVTARPRLNGGTSGGISMGKGQLHGRWEFRARADPGTGYSPAVLLWPDSERFPIDGELDMLEAPVGDRSTASAYVHYGADNKTRGAQVNGDFTQWHTFAFEWLPNRLTWYVDGTKQWEITDRTVIPTKPMHLCIQLDQGPAAKFMPAPDATTPDEVRMQVDWARQYEVG